MMNFFHFDAYLCCRYLYFTPKGKLFRTRKIKLVRPKCCSARFGWTVLRFGWTDYTEVWVADCTEVWVDCTEVWLDRLYWGLGGRLYWGLGGLYWGLVGQTALRFGWQTVQHVMTSESQAHTSIHQPEIKQAICGTIEVCYWIWGKWKNNSAIIIIFYYF